jgi:hypothetical protein
MILQTIAIFSRKRVYIQAIFGLFSPQMPIIVCGVQGYTKENATRDSVTQFIAVLEGWYSHTDNSTGRISCPEIFSSTSLSKTNTLFFYSKLQPVAENIKRRTS